MVKLLQTVESRIEAEWDGPPLNGNLSTVDMLKWSRHYHETGYRIADEFERDGLSDTASFIRNEVDKIVKYHLEYFERAFEEQKYAEARTTGKFIGYDQGLRIRMIGQTIEGFAVSFKTSKEEWTEWWEKFTDDQRSKIALQVQMTFGREAHQKVNL